MSNVLQLAPKPAPNVRIEALIQALERSFALNRISGPAFHIGAYVAAKMRELNSPGVKVELIELTQFYIERNGNAFATGKFWTEDEISQGLQDLQKVIGLCNHTSLDRVARIKDPSYHFTDKFQRRRPLVDLVAPWVEVYFLYVEGIMPAVEQNYQEDDATKRMNAEKFAVL